MNSFENDDEHLKVYPNPSQNGVYVDIKSKSQIEYLKLYSIKGQLKLSRQVNANIYSERLDLSNVGDGMYILTVKMDGKLISEKIVVQK